MHTVEYYLHSVLMNEMDKGSFPTWDQFLNKRGWHTCIRKANDLL